MGLLQSPLFDRKKEYTYTHTYIYIYITSKTNAAKGVPNHYNENEKFHEREVEVHICFSLMEMSGMTKMDGIPCFCFGNNKH